MSEVLTQQPGLVEDQAKAEIMAYASRGQEEIVVAERALAIDAAANIGNSNFRDERNRGALHSAEQHAEYAANARDQANVQALGAAAIYEKVKAL